MGKDRRLTVLYAVTDPITATAFLRGQFGFLTKEGFDVHLACGSSPALRGLAAEEGITLHDVPLTRSWRLDDAVRAMVRAVRILILVRPQAVNYSTPKASLVWAIATWLRRPPLVVYLVRGLRLEGESRRSLRFWLLRLMEFISCRSAHRVVCVSEGLRRRATALKLVRASRTLVLGSGSSNGVDTKRFARAAQLRAGMRGELGYSSGETVIGFVGRLTRDKGIRELLAAVSRLDNRFRLLLVGSPEPDVNLPELIEVYPALRGRVRHVEHTISVESYYAVMDMFILPSYREGMSNALLEAQAAGVPCITTEVVGCLDAVLPGVSALAVPPRSPDAIVRAIDELAFDEDKRRSMAKAGMQWVRENFDQHALWRRYLELYTEPHRP